METEYQGPRSRALLLEARQHSWRSLSFRLAWESARKLGWLRRRYRPSTRTVRQVLDSFPLTERTNVGLLDYFRRRRSVNFFFQRDSLADIRRVFAERLPHAAPRLIAEADRICRREFSFLGSRTLTFPAAIDWHSSFESEDRWPLRHWTDIDIRSPACPGDVKRTWELNRTQFFVTLARAYVFTGDGRYALELATQMRSWLGQNPSEIGVNWYSNLECALRSISWLFALEMTLQWDGWDPDLFAEIVLSLIDHQDHIYKDLIYSQNCMINNHLIGDAMGLAMLSFYLPELEHSSRYQRRALNILFREGPRQILEDGAGCENAMSYHRFVFYMYVLVGLFLEKNDVRMPDEIWIRLERMCDFLTHLRTPSKSICQIGDWDNGRTIVLDDSSVEDFTSMLCTGAVRFNRRELKDAAGEFREEALWLLGPTSAEAFDRLPAMRSPTLDAAHIHGGFCT